MQKFHILSAIILMLPHYATGGWTGDDRFIGELKEIINPHTLLLRSDKREYTLVLNDIHRIAGSTCQSTHGAHCEFIEESLSNKRVGVTITHYNDGLFYGDVTYDGYLLSLELVEKGYARVAPFGRSPAHLNAEFDALCHYRGIWAKYQGEMEYAKMCQSRD